MTQPKRTKHFIDKKVQGALARRILFHWVVFLAMAFVVSFIVQVLSDPFVSLSTHVENLWWTQGPFLLVTIFLLPVFVVDTVKLSHRFAGPVFSLRRAIREVAAGKPARRLKFRHGDFWQELAQDYNAMLVRFGALDGESVAPAKPEQQLVESVK